MTRLIDADALIEDIENEINKKTKVILLADYNHFYCSGMRNAIRLAKRLPTADPVKHGRWKFAKDVYVSCSVCGVTILLFNAENPNYCPHCGAKMDGKEE